MSSIRFRLALAVLALVLVPLTGCAGNKDTSATTGSPTQRPNASDQLLQYTRCMRAHGVSMPDPSDEDAPLPKPEGNPSVQAANEQCRRYLPAKMQGNGTDARQHDNLVALARCLRQRGVSVPDPLPGQSLSLPRGSSHDQRVQNAIAACGKSGKSGKGRQTGEGR
jgi:hypothetical protein